MVHRTEVARFPAARSVGGLARAAFGIAYTAAATSVALGEQFVTRDDNAFCRASLRWAKVLAKRWGMTVHIKGASFIPQHEPCILMCNHRSYADIVALFSCLPVYPHFVAKRELGYVPFLGQAIRAGHHILIDRRNGRAARSGLAQAAAGVRSGKSVLIFPEGTRTRVHQDQLSDLSDPALGAFRTGGFRLAQAAGVPIVPIGMRGTSEVLPPGSLLVNRGEVLVNVGQPIPAERVTSSQLRPLVAEVEEAIASLLVYHPDDYSQAMQ